MSDDQPLPPGMEVLWRRPEAPRPGRRPGLTLEQVTAAGIAVADAEGLAALSMAKVAERLGVTTMALYRYVAGKDELLALMYDAALAAPEDPDDPTGSWRPRLTAWCRGQLDLVTVHPWVVQLVALQPVGPQRLGWVERGLAALEETPLPLEVRLSLIGMLSLHVLTEGQLMAAAAEQAAGRGGQDHPALVDYGTLLSRVVDPVRHPRVAEALAAGAFDIGTDEDWQGQQELALELLMDGVEALIRRYGG